MHSLFSDVRAWLYFRKDELWRVQEWCRAATHATPALHFSIRRPDGNTKVHLVAGELRELCLQACGYN